VARRAISETGKRRLAEAARRLGALLPGDWRVTGTATSADTGELTIQAPDGTATSVYVIAVDRFEPRDLDRWRIPSPSVVAASWVSPRTRELLRDLGAGYIDATGNVEFRLAAPAVYLRTNGDPNPLPRKGPSLRGPRAWALVRTLIEVTPPYTAGELSADLGLDDGYVSRSLQVLADERLVERRPRGPVTAVSWEPLLRRLVASYTMLDANQTTTWIATAGPAQLLRDLSDKRVGRWAVTASFVASAIAPVAAPEIAVIYTDDPERVAKNARLLPATSGANVILAAPYDPIVFRRGRVLADLPAVSIAQAAVDALTGPGRMPSEGEALVAWMRRNETSWRATKLEG
jgi:DNA-binding transcriptional ArsR family regulator